MSLFQPSPFRDLPSQTARFILADPPWLFEAYSEMGHEKNALAHYQCMPLADIKALPVAELADPNGCFLVMWATAPMLPQAIETMTAWGFRYATAGAWAKRTSTDKHWQFSTGYAYRNAVEFYLLGRLGNPQRRSKSVRNLIVAPVREHSRKPDQMHLDCEAISRGPYVELFARASRPGWLTWGNQAQKFDHPIPAGAVRRAGKPGSPSHELFGGEDHVGI